MTSIKKLHFNFHIHNSLDEFQYYYRKEISPFRKFPVMFFLILSLCFSDITVINAQQDWIKFENITPEMGLSQATVHCILQDSKGFLWFGTEDGLNKYDGYNFKIYRHIEKDSTSISDNFIWSLCEDRDGTIWVGTSTGGLNKYDREKNIFSQYKHNPNDPQSLSQNDVRTIFEDSFGNLWIGTNNGGLNKFDKATETFTHFLHNPLDENSLSSNSIKDIIDDENGNLWIATNGGGLNKFNQTTGEFSRYTVSSKENSTVNNNFIWSLLRDKNGRIWIGTNGGGLNVLDPSSMRFTYYSEETSTANRIVNNNVTSLYEDQKGLIWIGTEGGLSIFDPVQKKFTNITHEPSRSGSLSNNIIRVIKEDKSGLIWIGTVGGGVNKYNRARKRFINYQNDPSNKNSLSSNLIRSIYEDTQGMLWIGTLGGGLNRFDKFNNQYTHYKHNNQIDGSISDDRITSIYEDSKRNLWVGTWGGGLNRLPNLGQSSYPKFYYYKQNTSKPYSLPSDTIQAVYEDSFGNLWVGTEAGLGVLVDDDKFARFKHDVNNPNSLSDDRIQSKCIHQDNAQNLWIGTWNGLNRISSLEKIDLTNARNISFEVFTSDAASEYNLSDNRVISIYEDPSSTKDVVVLWIGTVAGGLNKMIITRINNKEEIVITHYTERDGLPNNAIYGILGDDKGNLWLSTNNGLSKFDPVEETFRNYNENDGLQSNQFYWGASFKSRDGQMFFGGVNGITAFYPEQLKDNQHIPEVYIVDMQLFNKSLTVSEDSPLTKSILETEEIELPYDSYVITFEFVALDYTNPENNNYSYMLEGFDKDWIPSGTRRFVTYSGIGAGEYEFKVRGSNNDGVWNMEGTSLKINILPPFWATLWFISLVIIVIAGLVVYVITSYVRQLLAVERLRTKLAADLHDNIGSSLTEISILSEVISKRLKDEDESVQKSLKRISEDSRSLIDKMSDIVWLVNPKRDTLYDLILRLEDTYSELLSLTNISFTSKNLKSLEKISLSMEHRQHLYLIFKEGINNCITHAQCTEINLDAHVNGKNLVMILTDNGKGFDVDKDYQGNGLNNMINRAEQIGGELIISSEIGKGTKLEFRGKIG